MKPTKKHTFQITVSMDRACGRALALALVKDELRGQDFYCSSYADKAPDQFIIRSIRSTKARARK